MDHEVDPALRLVFQTWEKYKPDDGEEIDQTLFERAYFYWYGYYTGMRNRQLTDAENVEVKVRALESYRAFRGWDVKPKLPGKDDKWMAYIRGLQNE